MAIYNTREGPRSIEDIRAGIIAAGGTPTGDDQKDVAIFNGAGGGGGETPGSGDRKRLVDAQAEGNERTLQERIDDAIRRYALARTAEERNQAYLDLQRWQAELGKVQNQQKTVTDMAAAVMSAASSLSNRPADYIKHDQIVSGGRDIFDRISGKGGPTAAYGGPTGQVQPGSVWDLLGRLGISYPVTPETPAGVQPGAKNPSNPDLPAVPVPGAAGSTTLPSHEEMLAALDVAAGGRWDGNREDRGVVASTWWNADPARRGKPMPGATTAGTTQTSGGFPDFDTMKQGLREAGWGGNYDDRAAVHRTWWEADPARRGKPMPAWS